MKELLKHREKKAGILEDMLSCITYTPNREQDILAFMERYQKSDSEERPAILDSLRRCMDGQDYPNPYAGCYCYTKEDVALCETALDDYIDGLIAAGGDKNTIRLCAWAVTDRLNALNGQCGGGLIDPWRGERLREFIGGGAELAGLYLESAPVFEQKMW